MEYRELQPACQGNGKDYRHGSTARVVRGFEGLDVGDQVPVTPASTDGERGFIDLVRAPPAAWPTSEPAACLRFHNGPISFQDL
jgi:hypothetical protein